MNSEYWYILEPSSIHETWFVCEAYEDWEEAVGDREPGQELYCSQVPLRVGERVILLILVLDLGDTRAQVAKRYRE